MERDCISLLSYALLGIGSIPPKILNWCEERKIDPVDEVLDCDSEFLILKVRKSLKQQSRKYWRQQIFCSFIDVYILIFKKHLPRTEIYNISWGAENIDACPGNCNHNHHTIIPHRYYVLCFHKCQDVRVRWHLLLSWEKDQSYTQTL